MNSQMGKFHVTGQELPWLYGRDRGKETPSWRNGKIGCHLHVYSVCLHAWESESIKANNCDTTGV